MEHFRIKINGEGTADDMIVVTGLLTEKLQIIRDGHLRAYKGEIAGVYVEIKPVTCKPTPHESN
jgi:hypothetical protein